MPELLGQNLVACTFYAMGDERFRATNAATGESMEPEFRVATPWIINSAVATAAAGQGEVAAVSPSVRAQFLDRIAERIEGLGDALIERAHAETALPVARLTGERARTCAQLRMFAQLIRDDRWKDERFEAADSDRKPLPKPELRRTVVPIGPVAVFGASNFPLAFSVAGGDTASALAAGCPVIVKAHPAHPGTSELVAGQISAAADELDIPQWIFSMIHGGPEVGRALVEHPDLRAVAFTGSHHAGRALFDLANARPRPIPVFAEMGSVNPVFVLPNAGLSWAKGYAESLTLGVGQFCTNPGVLVIDQGRDDFIDAIVKSLRAVAKGTMLTAGIGQTYCEGRSTLASHPGVETLLLGEGPGTPSLFRTTDEAFLADPTLQQELFGPAGLVVVNTGEWMVPLAHALEGQLTATILMGPGDEETARILMRTLVRIAGRIVVNGFPTGVEVNTAMQHGGPYPATTDSRFTSVGTAAIQRFVRPVAFQNVPPELTP